MNSGILKYLLPTGIPHQKPHPTRSNPVDTAAAPRRGMRIKELQRHGSLPELLVTHTIAHTVYTVSSILYSLFSLDRYLKLPSC